MALQLEAHGPRREIEHNRFVERGPRLRERTPVWEPITSARVLVDKARRPAAGEGGVDRCRPRPDTEFRPCRAGRRDRPFCPVHHTPPSQSLPVCSVVCRSSPHVRSFPRHPPAISGPDRRWRSSFRRVDSPNPARRTGRESRASSRGPRLEPRSGWCDSGPREHCPISRIRCQVLPKGRPDFLLGEPQTTEASYLLERYRNR